MKTLHENIMKTHEYLDSHFQTSSNGTLTINIDYLLDSIKITLDNTRYLIEAVTANRCTKIESLVYSAILELCDMELKFDGFKSSSYHIKKWFEKYNLDYKEVLKPLIEAYKEEREEALNN